MMHEGVVEVSEDHARRGPTLRPHLVGVAGIVGAGALVSTGSLVTPIEAVPLVPAAVAALFTLLGALTAVRFRGLEDMRRFAQALYVIAVLASVPLFTIALTALGFALARPWVEQPSASMAGLLSFAVYAAPTILALWSCVSATTRQSADVST